jgi:hypothetical protein
MRRRRVSRIVGYQLRALDGCILGVSVLSVSILDDGRILRFSVLSAGILTVGVLGVGYRGLLVQPGTGEAQEVR